MEKRMAEEFKAKFLDAWPAEVIEDVRRETQGIVVESESTKDRRLIPLHDVAPILSALSATVSLGRALWSWRKDFGKDKTPEVARDKEKLNQEVRRSGNFGAEVLDAQVTSSEPLRVEVSIRNPPQTQIRQFVLEIAGDGAEIKQKS